jgi:hypothetical protein
MLVKFGASDVSVFLRFFLNIEKIMGYRESIASALIVWGTTLEDFLYGFV